MPELVIPEDLKLLCNKLVRQEPITAAESWPLIERIARAEQALTEERQHTDELAKDLRGLVDNIRRERSGFSQGYEVNNRWEEIADNALVAHDARRKQEGGTEPRKEG